MAKGKSTGVELVAYNSKISQDLKDTLEALVDVLKEEGVSGQRELLERMVDAYRQARPDVFEQAEKLVALKHEARNIVYRKDK
jgi:collagenase-like PrtC family protease